MNDVHLNALLNKHRKELEQETQTLEQALAIAQYLAIDCVLQLRGNVIDEAARDLLFDVVRRCWDEISQNGVATVTEQ